MDPLPPETTTPMPPMFHIVAPRLFPKPPPPKPPITPRPRRWPAYIANMSDHTDSVQPRQLPPSHGGAKSPSPATNHENGHSSSHPRWQGTLTIRARSNGSRT